MAFSHATIAIVLWLKALQDRVVLDSFKKTKIVATLGPASSTTSVIRDLYNAGVNVFRLNFSHGNHETHKKNASIIRSIEQESSRYVAIMMDLQGPKIRIGVFEDGQISLRNGSKFTLDNNSDFGNSMRVTLPHPEIFRFIEAGAEILLDDGKIKLLVTDNNGDRIETKVITGGILSNKKGVNFPNVLLPIEVLTEKDKKDIRLAEIIGVDYVAVSFIQKQEDIQHVRKFLDNEMKIIAKIEKPEAVQNLDSIVEEADAIMIARGDLGVEMPVEMIPCIQRKIVEKCRQSKKPVIVATQMMESMIQNPVPTRAEVSDVATAVYQGADAVMLSAESASGKFPVETVKIMSDVIIHTENDIDTFQRQQQDKTENHSVDHAITIALNRAVKISGIKTIVAFTESGRTSMDVSQSRPNANIIALTPNIRTAREMCLVWGTQAMLIEDLYSFTQMTQVVQTRISEFCKVENNDKVIIVAGVPFRRSGRTNILHICEIEKDQIVND
ncbi:MAG: pyruvate kinase [Holosporales bacterium]|nr:pyruvate kinase [Holosporales bacterium]